MRNESVAAAMKWFWRSGDEQECVGDKGERKRETMSRGPY